VESSASSASALARAGEVTTTNDVASMLAADALPTCGVIDMGKVAGLPGTLPSLPIRETRTRGASALRHFLGFGLTLCTDSGGPRIGQEVVANPVGTISFQLRVYCCAESLVAPTGVTSGKTIIALDVVPEGRVRANLIVECAQEHIVIRPLWHLQQTLISIVHEPNEVVVTHGQSLKHAMSIHERIDSADLVMFADRPEKLPSLHQDARVRQLTLFQLHLQRQGRFNLGLESKEQFSV
jgi:hypothetical protein